MGSRSGMHGLLAPLPPGLFVLETSTGSSSLDARSRGLEEDAVSSPSSSVGVSSC